MPWECLIPRKQRKYSKSQYSKPNDVEVYGLRPMIHPWKLLSPFEFAMKWKAEPVLPPHAYSRNGLEQRSEWAKNVEAAVRSEQKLAIPIVHYFVAEPTDVGASQTYFTFPLEPKDTYAFFRHAWVLVRKPRPEVPVLEGIGMPRASGNPTYNAKYCSTFFRPWCLVGGSAEVPHLGLLGCAQETLQHFYTVGVKNPKRRRMSTKGPDRKINSSIAGALNFHCAWEEYIRGNVVSQNSVRLIKSFLMNTIAATHYEDDIEAQSEADRSDAVNDAPSLKLTVHALKTSMSAAVRAEETNASGNMGQKIKENVRTRTLQAEYTDQMSNCERL